MPPPNNREREIFDAALELTSSEARSGYLIGVCGKDDGMRARVEALLLAHEQAGGFLPMDDEKSTAGALPEAFEMTADNFAGSETVGDRIGRYKLLEKIGEGGCGVVYMAVQEEPIRRKVALKVIKLGMDTKSVIARFEAERQALAMMDHPNIAKVLDAGATVTGRPFFVMELVRGVKITDYCDENQLYTRERLDLFVQVCQAIQHAHQKGVIHRDIKPSNILVTVNDGVAVPKVIDFGIAKATQGRLTDQTLFTAFEQFIGTPAYMSPEQAVMTSLDIDTRSDIYSLGVLLYELLTGKTPFDANELMRTGLDELRRTIVEKEPIRPSTRLSTMQGADLTATAKHRRTEALQLIHIIRGDLDWIVMKALEKDRSRRYETSNGLARDVQRYLKDEPVMARPPSTLYLFQKVVRRNKVVFGAAAVMAVSLLLGLGVTTVAMFRIKQAKDDATEKLRIAYLAQARGLRASGSGGQRFASLETVRKAAAIRPDMEARNEAIASLAVSDLRVAKQVILTGHARNDAAIFDLNLEKYAFGDTNGNITIRAASNNAILEVLSAPGFKLEIVNGFSSNGKYLTARYRSDGEGQSCWVWDLENQKAVVRALQQKNGANESGFNFACDFSSDSRLFASTCLDGTISVYDLASGRESRHFLGNRLFNKLVLNPQNTRLACSSPVDPGMEIRDVESGQILLTLACANGVSAVAWSADGKRLATACLNFSIYVWDAETGRRLEALEGPANFIMSVAFSHEGSLLASSGWDGISRLWNLDTGRQIASHDGGGWALQFSPDDRQLIGWQNVARYGSLEVACSRECRQLFVQRDGGFISCPEFSADGRILAAASDDKVRFWDAGSGKEIASFREKICESLIFHPDGRSLIAVDKDGICKRTLAQLGGSGSPAYLLGKPVRFFESPELHQAALSQDGRHLAVTQLTEGRSIIYDLQDASKVMLSGHPNVSRIALSPDGRWAATGAWLNSLVKVWDARSGDLVRSFSMPARAWLAFSPDGRWLGISSKDYQLLEVGSWQPKGPAQPGCEDPVFDFTAFSPDSSVMARTIDGRNIQLLETATEQPLAILEAPVSSGVTRFQFSPDGTRLAAMQRDQQVQLWDLRLIRQELELMHLDWDMPPYPPAEKTTAPSPVTLEVESDPVSETSKQ